MAKAGEHGKSRSGTYQGNVRIDVASEASVEVGVACMR